MVWKVQPKFFNKYFIVCNLCQIFSILYHPFSCMVYYNLLQLLVFFCISVGKVLSSGFFQFNGNFVNGQNNSKYRDCVPLSTTFFLWNLTKTMFLLQVVGYLNLLANSIDNFTHGLAVAGSFIVSTKVSQVALFQYWI